MNLISRRRVLTAAALVIPAASAAQETIPAPGASPTSLPGTAGTLLGLGSIVVFLGSKVWEYYNKKSGNDARDNLSVATDVTATNTIARQEQRIKTLEDRIDELEKRVNSESDLRRQYQDTTVVLRMRVAQLEQILRDHNIPVPTIPSFASAG